MVFTRRNLDWWCERAILLLVLALLVFAPAAFGAVYVWSFLVVQGLVILLAAVWLLRLWGGYKPKLLWPPLAWAVMAFVLYALVRYFTVDVEYVARQELIRILLYAFLFLAVVSNLYSQDAAEIITYTLTAVAALLSSYAVSQFLHHSNHVWNLTSPYVGRASGTYINPDHFAGFLELVLPLPLAFLLAARIGVVTRLLLGYATLAILGGMAVTFSRGGWVAMALGVLLLLGFLLCHRNHRLRALLVLVGLLAGGGFGTVHYLSSNLTFKQRVGLEDDGPSALDTQSRMQMWTAAAEMGWQHPWWGVGPGLFDSRFREYRPPLFQMKPEHAHDDYLELFADWGLAGVLIVFGGIGIFMAGLVKTWPHVRREENDFGSGMSTRYAFFLGAGSGLFALAVHSLVDFNLHVPANVLVGVTLLGLLASNLRFATKRHWLRARLPLQWALTLLFGGFVFYLATQGWRRGHEEWLTKRAESLPDYSNEQTAALEKALACEPANGRTAYLIGERYRLQSSDGGEDYAALAQKAMTDYAQGIRDNPHDAYCLLGMGMCLDWLGRHADAEPYYMAAEACDPNGNYIVAYIGLHFIQVNDYSAARQLFTRAAKLSNWKNEMAKNYLFNITNPRLQERASGKLPISLFYDGKGN